MRESGAERQRLSSMGGEVARFLAVGGLGFVVDVGLFNLLRFNLGLGDGEGVLVDKPITAKIISVVVATMVTYAGNSEVVLGRTSAVDKGSLHAAIDRLRGSGGTAMAPRQVG